MLDWWTLHHTGTKFTHLKMGTMIRQTDMHSCGIFAFLTLARFLLLTQYPVIKPKEVYQLCLQLLLHVAEWHLDKVSHACAAFKQM